MKRGSRTAETRPTNLPPESHALRRNLCQPGCAVCKPPHIRGHYTWQLGRRLCVQQSRQAHYSGKSPADVHRAHTCAIRSRRDAQSLHARATRSPSFFTPNRLTSGGNRVRRCSFHESCHVERHRNGTEWHANRRAIRQEPPGRRGFSAALNYVS